jgi:hypothetical protein
MGQANTDSSDGRQTAPTNVEPARPLPDFVIIGAAKSATSLLANYLKRHPQVFFCPKKEPLFFAYERFYGQGFEPYRQLFAGARSDQLCGEASTDYTRYPQVTGVPERLAAANPRMKLIYIMRHPVDRAYSHYVHRYTKELHHNTPITRDFTEHVKSDPMCIDGSLYAVQLDQYLKYFPMASILPLATEDFRNDLGGTLARVYQFLGIEVLSGAPPELPPNERNERERFLNIRMVDQVSQPLRKLTFLRGIAKAVVPKRMRNWIYKMMMNTPRGKRMQASFTPPPLLPDQRRQLIEFYEPHNRRLEDMIGRKFPGWRN